MTAARLALSNLLHERIRSLISIIGAAFAVVLIFMQLGFLGSVETTATILYNRLNFDILLTSSEYLDFSRPGSLKRVRLAQAYSASGVAEVLPLSTGPGLWKNPDTTDAKRFGRRYQITLLGADPGTLDRLFGPEPRGVFDDVAARDAARVALAQLRGVMIDRRSRSDFGPTELLTGQVVELSGQQIELLGTFEVGTGFSYTGLLLMNEETFSQFTARPDRNVTFGLVRLKPGQPVDQVAAELREILPPDVKVFTRAEISELERDYWINKTAVGKLFTFGVLLALLVGAIFVYQMMVADIKKHMPEYATLKAVGYRLSYLFGVVFWQAGYLAVCGYSLGLTLSLILYELTKTAAKLPIAMNWERMVIVLGLTVGMCVGSALIAVRKVQHADPADLF